MKLRLMPKVAHRISVLVQRTMLAGVLGLGLVQSGAAEVTQGPVRTTNAVERYAAEWEQKFVLKDYAPADELGKALHAYFTQLFAALGTAAGGDPRDISRIVGEARENLTEETARMIDTFVAAGYGRLDAELYFDRLYPRLQVELARSFIREDAGRTKSVKREDSTVSDGLLDKAVELHYEKKDSVGALKSLDDALRFAPANVRVTLDTALQQQKFGQLVEARENFDLARELYPKIVNIHIAMGDIRARARDYYGAIESLTTAIYLQPSAVMAYSIRGDAKMGLEDYQGAINDYGMQIASGARPGLGASYHRRAQAHFALGNLEFARTDVETAIQVEPNFAADYRTLGMIHHRLGNYGASVTALNRAIELRPDYAAAYTSRIWSRVELGSDAAALADADRLVALQGGNAFSRLIRASLYDFMDRPEVAEKEYREAVLLGHNKSDNTAWYYANFHLDLLLRRQGRGNPEYLKDVLEWPDEWPKRIALHLAGRITADSLLAASRQATKRIQRLNQECEASYYVGMLLWTTGRQDEAVAHLKAAANPDFVGNLEHTHARKILRSMGIRPE